tara:strand:- start:9488 stop:9820 length:333 start_codon:yes stop_codon:yes gene_type:complete
MKLIPKQLVTIAFSSLFLSIPGLSATVNEQAFIIGILASEKCQVRKGANQTLLRAMIKDEVKKMNIDVKLLKNNRLNQGAYYYSLDLDATCGKSTLSDNEQENLLMKYIK